jgi:hypothetical protein
MNEGDVVDRPRGLLVFATILAVTTTWLGIRLPAGIASYREIFASLGVLPPPLTRAVLAIPYAWLIFMALAVPLLVWVSSKPRVTRRELGRMKFALRAVLIFTLLAYGLAAVAIYLPIMKMRAAV